MSSGSSFSSFQMEKGMFDFLLDYHCHQPQLTAKNSFSLLVTHSFCILPEKDFG